MTIQLKNRLSTALQIRDKKLLSVYYTAGYPSLHDTLPIAKALEKAGANLLEIGIPFSDPVADGPTIQASSKIALENGMTIALLFEQIKSLRDSVTIPIILMGYINPVLQFGMERFLATAAACGVDGLILPDLPIDVYLEEYVHLFEKYKLSMVFLVTPETAEARIREIDALSTSFIYAVSSSSTTGKQGAFSQEQVDYLKKLEEMRLKSPLIVGFGISNRETFQTASKHTQGAIIGSAFIRALDSDGSLGEKISRFVKDIM